MIVPKEIVEMMEKVNELEKDIFEWAKENIDIDGSDLSIRDYQEYTPHFIFKDEPTGEKQTNGEYCDQWQYGDDWYKGVYYYPTYNNKYLALDFDV